MPIRVLVVDDEPEICHLIADMLASRGYEVETAKDGREGLFKFRKGQFDRVVTDWNMPFLNGYGMVLEILKLDPTVKIVMVSGDSSNKPPEGFGIPLLAKPFRTKDLLDALA